MRASGDAETLRFASQKLTSGTVSTVLSIRPSPQIMNPKFPITNFLPPVLIPASERPDPCIRPS